MTENIVVIGASAGGVEALRELVAGLPADLPAAVLVVLHLPSYGHSVLPSILQRAGRLPARHAVSGDRLVAGQILVAPPDHHLLVQDGTVLLSHGPRENGHRPAVDVLFRSAARARGAGLICVVLSGVLDDGTAGAVSVHHRGGSVLVQDPAEAAYPAMPNNVLKHVKVDFTAPAKELAAIIDRLARVERPPVPASESATDDAEIAFAAMQAPTELEIDPPGIASGFSCPDCGGGLFEIRDGELVRYRCRVGHAWSPESLLGEQSDQLESALWMALRTLDEKAALSRQLAERAGERGSLHTAQRFGAQADEAARAATLIRRMLENPPAQVTPAV